jgi:MoxR-like ATPase
MVQVSILTEATAQQVCGVEAYWPLMPESAQATGLPVEFLGELLLKSLYVGGPATLEDLGQRLALSYGVLDELTARLKSEQSIEATSATGYSEWGIRYRLTAAGAELAENGLERSRYTGVAPVTLDDYAAMTRLQSLRRNPPTREMLEQAFTPFILDAQIKDSLARIFFSGRTVLIFGESGNGKTSIVESFARTLTAAVLFPHALYVAGQVIRIYDPVRHAELPVDAPEGDVAVADSLLRTGGRSSAYDRRWTKIRRPVVVAGGELEIPDLNLSFDTATRQYQAPAHVKAQDGIFLIDDFGRQRARPEEILNRWIVPLESGVDHLTLQTGESFSIPFEMAVIFASNLKPQDLADEAFLRRLPYKINLPGPDRGQFAAIARMWFRRLEIEFDDDVVDYLTGRVFDDPGIVPRATHPRDLGLMVLDYARYDKVAPTLTRDYIDKACAVYFIYGS